eukprot:350242-Pyramimonas_sp.AAC.1
MSRFAEISCYIVTCDVPRNGMLWYASLCYVLSFVDVQWYTLPCYDLSGNALLCADDANDVV